MSRCSRCVRGVIVAAAGLGVAALHAAPFAGRIDSVLSAADQYLAAGPTTATAYPAELRRIAWLQLAGDNLPDAFLVLKARKDECAVAASGPAPCKALVMQAGRDGSYRVATEFNLLVHPVAFETGARGVQALLYTRDAGAEPRYRRYDFNGQSFASTGEVDSAGIGRLRAFTLDDRNMSTVADQAYAARQFPNDSARLSPFRLHYDAVSISAEQTQNALIFDADHGSHIKRLLDALQPDAARLTAAIGWPQTLELRLWTCVDWMVSRRFWEVEDRRVGRVGVCADPMIFAFRQRLVTSNDDLAALARYRLMREVGIAYLLRVAPIALATRSALKTPERSDLTIFTGAAAGLLIAQALKLQSLDEAANAHRVLQQVSTRWFEEHERKRNKYERRTPELRSFDHELDLAGLALACARQGLGDAAPKPASGLACPKDMAERVDQMRIAVKESLAP